MAACVHAVYITYIKCKYFE